jgi:hypothetical protein
MHLCKMVVNEIMAMKVQGIYLEHGSAIVIRCRVSGEEFLGKLESLCIDGL